MRRSPVVCHCEETPSGVDVAIRFSLMPCPCSGRSLPIAMGRWRAAPVGHPCRFPCALRRVQGNPFCGGFPVQNLHGLPTSRSSSFDSIVPVEFRRALWGTAERFA